MVTKALKWLGLGLGFAALALLARLYLVRRTEPSLAFAANSDELRMPRELGFKESVMARQEPMATDNPLKLATADDR
jgi:hypothetical protein